MSSRTSGEYRLGLVSDWPASDRKQATLEAISRRLAGIARLSLGPDDAGLLAVSCRLLEDVFAAAERPRAG